MTESQEWRKGDQFGEAIAMIQVKKDGETRMVSVKGCKKRLNSACSLKQRK